MEKTGVLVLYLRCYAFVLLRVWWNVRTFTIIVTIWQQLTVDNVAPGKRLKCCFTLKYLVIRLLVDYECCWIVKIFAEKCQCGQVSERSPAWSQWPLVVIVAWNVHSAIVSSRVENNFNEIIINIPHIEMSMSLDWSWLFAHKLTLTFFNG